MNYPERQARYRRIPPFYAIHDGDYRSFSDALLGVGEVVMITPSFRLSVHSVTQTQHGVAVALKFNQSFDPEWRKLSAADEPGTIYLYFKTLEDAALYPPGKVFTVLLEPLP